MSIQQVILCVAEFFLLVGCALLAAYRLDSHAQSRANSLRMQTPVTVQSPSSVVPDTSAANAPIPVVWQVQAPSGVPLTLVNRLLDEAKEREERQNAELTALRQEMAGVTQHALKSGVEAERLKFILKYVTAGYRLVERPTATLEGYLVRTDDTGRPIESLPVPNDTPQSELQAYKAYSRVLDRPQALG